MTTSSTRRFRTSCLSFKILSLVLSLSLSRSHSLSHSPSISFWQVGEKVLAMTGNKRAKNGGWTKGVVIATWDDGKPSTLNPK